MFHLQCESAIEILFELLLQLVFEALAEMGISSVRHATSRSRHANPALAALGFLLLGGLCGALSGWLLPNRLLPAPPVANISLVAAPVAGGVMMHLYGKWKRTAGKDPSLLATYWGGALFAFAFAIARLVLMGWGTAQPAV